MFVNSSVLSAVYFISQIYKLLLREIVNTRSNGKFWIKVNLLLKMMQLKSNPAGM